MEQNKTQPPASIIGKDLVRYFILVYWILFWLFNVVDKLIGGAHFLFVGRDRFAQMERYFDSIGLGHPLVADAALIITAGLEIFALVFFVGALYHFVRRDIDTTRSWFFIGISLTLLTFTYFSIGDQIFGDHFELLEHSLFWFITLLSWVVFIRAEHIQLFDSFSIGKKQFTTSVVFIVLLSIVASVAIFWHNDTSFVERTQAVEAVQTTDNKYKFTFPFLAGSTAFESSLAKFKKDHPDLAVSYIYTAPKQLRLGQADGLIIYVQTEKK